MFNAGISCQKYSTNNVISHNNISTDGEYAVHFDETSTGNTVTDNNLSSTQGGGNAAVYDPSGKNKVSGNIGSRYVPTNGSSSSNSQSSSSNPYKGNSGGSNNGGSSVYSGNSESSGSSAFGIINLGLLANALSSIVFRVDGSVQD